MYRYDEIVKVADARGIFSDFSTPANVGYLLCEWARLSRFIEEGMLKYAQQSIGFQYCTLVRILHHNAVPTVKDSHTPVYEYDPFTALSEEYLLLGLNPTTRYHYIWAVVNLRAIASQHGMQLEECVDAVLVVYVEPW